VTALLAAGHLRFGYAPGRDVLAGVSLSLSAGRVGVLLGPNGSGKSTLLRVLLGHLAPSAGEVSWDGKPLDTMRPRELARLVAYLPQSPAHEPGQTVGEVVRAGRTPYLGAFGVESERDVEVVRRTVALLELGDLVDRPIDELSGGQRQRVFVARALAQEPRAFLLDEPNTFLDLRHQAQLWALLRKLARERGLGILAASHDLNLSAAFADELMLLHEGWIVARGTAADVLDAGVLSRVYGIGMARVERAGRTPVVFPEV
jgi:iron complex transport system ATP-binding protein